MFFKKTTFNAKITTLKQRQSIIRAIRHFFDAREYMEVETPILQISPCMDTHIHAFATQYKDISLKDKQSLYLHTSPEFGMKKLLAAGCTQIYQICHVFRNCDDTKLHSPEFTMIEWYNTEHSYMQLMDEARALIQNCAQAIGVEGFSWQGQAVNVMQDWQKISIAEAFALYADLDLDSYLDNLDLFKEAARAKGLHVSDDDRWDDVFHRVMLEYIEPHLGMAAPTILYNYPKCMAALAQISPDNPHYAERFESYIAGVELANGFGELTDPAEQRERFVGEMNAKEAIYGERYPVDEAFIAALEQGLPKCSGIALGIDRLVMLATGAQHINDVLWHPVDLLGD
jgi:lysyl-tRNA synthetase class 2